MRLIPRLQLSSLPKNQRYLTCRSAESESDKAYNVISVSSMCLTLLAMKDLGCLNYGKLRALCLASMSLHSG